MPETSSETTMTQKTDHISEEILLKAWELMCTAKALTEVYEENAKVTGKYVHATSRGHEAIQLAIGLQVLPQDFLSAYYRDDSILLGIGLEPYELMLQLAAKRNDPFSGGRTYYGHPSLRRDNMPKIPHQSSATGMQAIPSTGVALGLKYKEIQGIADIPDRKAPIVVCSFGDASITEGEVAEAFQMAVLKRLPIIYLVQDNEWDISAKAEEIRVMDASEYAAGFKGLEVVQLDGTDLPACYKALEQVIHTVRIERRPFLVHAKVPLLNHHTSGIRMETYRTKEDLAEQSTRDPFPKFFQYLLDQGFKKEGLLEVEKKCLDQVREDLQRALAAEDPDPEGLHEHVFAPTPITEEGGTRAPADKEPTVMVDASLCAITELMHGHP